MSKAPLVDDVRASGVVAGVREAFVVAETQGLVRSVGFSLGDKVSEGQELLRVDDRIASLNLERAKEQYESARLELDAAERLTAAGRGFAGRPDQGPRQLQRRQGAVRDGPEVL